MERMPFALSPSDTFEMGERQPHSVTLTQPFELGIHEVTQEQYEQVMGTNSNKFKVPQNPVEQVSWNDAVEFWESLPAKLYFVLVPARHAYSHSASVGNRYM